MMNLDYFLQLLNGVLPLWILIGGGLAILLVDAFIEKSSPKLIYGLGIVVLLIDFVVTLSRWINKDFYQDNNFSLDGFSLFLIFVCLVIGVISLLNIYAYSEISKIKNHRGLVSDQLQGSLIALILFSISGMIIMFTSNHLILSFIGLEIMSMAIYVMAGSKRKDVRSNESALKYFVLGSVGSAVFIYGVAFIFGAYQSFDLRFLTTASSELSFLPQVGLALILVSLLFKLSLVPFHFWTPDVYEGAPSPVTGFMATGVKVAGVGFFIKLLFSLSIVSQEAVMNFIYFAVIATILVGNLGAIVQENIKRMLAFSSIAHAGFILLGLLAGLSGKQSIVEVSSSVFFYLFAYALTSLGAFAFLSLMVHGDEEVVYMSDLNGLAKEHPYLAASFSLFMLSLLGLPPTLGFMGKYGILLTVVEKGYTGLAIFGVLMSVVSAYYYLRPIVNMYFKPSTELPVKYHVPLPLIFSLIFCVMAVIIIGLMPQDYLNMASLALDGLK